MADVLSTAIGSKEKLAEKLSTLLGLANGDGDGSSETCRPAQGVAGPS